MNALTTTLDIPAFDPISYDAALRAATVRAQHSFFDQHVIEDDEGCFVAIDEGDYNALPQHLIDRIVHTVPGMMADDFDEAQYLANYADLRTAFGNDAEAATRHYITNGFAEGRTDEPLAAGAADFLM